MSNRARRRHPGPYAHLYGQEQPSGNANPRRLGGSIAGPGGPNDHGAAIVDMTDCVLADYIEVCAVDTIRYGESNGPATYMVIQGRINKTDERVQVGYMFGSDGAAALITELLALATRADTPEVTVDLVARLVELAKAKTINLDLLKMSIDLAERGMP